MPTVVEQHADAKLDLDELRAEKADEFGERIIELLENPGERSGGIANVMMGRLIERGTEELGSAELAEAYYGALAEPAQLSWSDLHAIPFADRGKVFSMAQEFVASWAYKQAYVEIMAVAVAELAEANGKRLGKVRNPDDLKGVRNTMAERKQIREEVGAELAQATEPGIG